MENVETIFQGLLELVRLDMQLRKTGKETAERRQVEDAINSVRAKLPEPILGQFDRQKSRGKLGIAPVHGGVCGACHLKLPLGLADPAAQHRHTSKADAKLQAALDYLTYINVGSQNRSDKWVINESILFSLTGCYGQIEARACCAFGRNRRFSFIRR